MTQMEALELALKLAIAAPDRQHMDEVMVLANQISSRLTPEEVQTVQEEIECHFDLDTLGWKV
jgi:hypothetical protein